MKNEMPDLKNCPFCGGNAQKLSDYSAGVNSPYVRCDHCHARLPEYGGDWNTRHYPELEPIREALEACSGVINVCFEPLCSMGPDYDPEVANAGAKALKALKILNSLK